MQKPKDNILLLRFMFLEGIFFLVVVMKCYGALYCSDKFNSLLRFNLSAWQDVVADSKCRNQKEGVLHVGTTLYIEVHTFITSELPSF